MARTFSYEIDGNLYINLTNYCSNFCTFCVGKDKFSYFGNDLLLDKEPTVKDVINSIDLTKQYNEIVFCGMGEPTYKIFELLTLAKHFKELGFKTRLNTNGQGNLIIGRDITKDLASVINVVNVSLNMPNEKDYDALCRSVFKEQAFNAVLSFAQSIKMHGGNVIFSIVDCIGKEKIEECKQLSEKLNIPLKIRELITNS